MDFFFTVLAWLIIIVIVIALITLGVIGYAVYIGYLETVKEQNDTKSQNVSKDADEREAVLIGKHYKCEHFAKEGEGCRKCDEREAICDHEYAQWRGEIYCTKCGVKYHR